MSIGPQSAADAYETLAYRERRRKESIGSNATPALHEKASTQDLLNSSNSNNSGSGANAPVTWVKIERKEYAKTLRDLHNTV